MPSSHHDTAAAAASVTPSSVIPSSVAPCRRCKGALAPYRLRNDPTCRNCYVEYVEAKAGRRLGALARDTRTSAKPAPRRYVAGLSFGPSSTVLTHALDDAARFHSSRTSSPPFEPLVVHVDTRLSPSARAGESPANSLLARYRRRFPHVSFECVNLSEAWRLTTVDWPSLLGIRQESEAARRGGGSGGGGADDDDDDNADADAEQLRSFLDSLPSLTSRADVVRLLVRHLLLDMALQRSYTALLLGHSTTALASLTLSEVANGRGFAVPWQVSDGPCTVCTYERGRGAETARAQMPVYYPLREVLRNEILLYLDLMPSLRELVPAGCAAASGSVVSHKDLTIDEVISRYFDGIEGPYSGVVANVVRTTGKLYRAAPGALCHLCGMTLDEQGDARWAGELGDHLGPHRHQANLCYGCKRSIGG